MDTTPHQQGQEALRDLGVTVCVFWVSLWVSLWVCESRHASPRPLSQRHLLDGHQTSPRKLRWRQLRLVLNGHYYPTNKDKRHCEIDVELYGYKSPNRVLLALNVFAQGKQNLAQVSPP